MLKILKGTMKVTEGGPLVKNIDILMRVKGGFFSIKY